MNTQSECRGINRECMFLSLYPNALLELDLESAFCPLCSTTLQAMEFRDVKLAVEGHLLVS